MKKSLFIVVDGMDGSGKTETVKMVHNYLFSKSKRYRILTTREPTNGQFGSKIRKMLNEESDPLESKNELVELFIKDREDHMKKTIDPFLDGGNENETNIVICDRYYYSTIAFQSAQGLDREMLIERNRTFRRPDISFILDVDPALALDRIKNRKKEKFEQLEFMKKIRENFLDMPKIFDENIVIIDSSGSLKSVFSSIIKEIENLI
jgi:dTMP kinase